MISMPESPSVAKLFLLLLGATVISLLLAFAIGTYAISFSNLLIGELSQVDYRVLVDLRLPRAALVVLVAMAMTLAGAMTQSYFQNPLADPGILGVTSGAALAVGIVIVCEAQISSLIGPSVMSFLAFADYHLMIAATLGGFFTCWVIIWLSSRLGVSLLLLLMAGMAINAIGGAFSGLLTYFSSDEQLRSMTLWAMGTFTHANWQKVSLLAVVVIPAIIGALRLGHTLNILQLGEAEAKNLGVDVAKARLKVLWFVAVLVGSAVAVVGIIGFVGLIVPHLVRMTISADNRVLLPLAMAISVNLLLLADVLSRVVVAPAELPVGLMTAMIGGPYFLWMLIQQRHRLGAAS